MDAHQSEGEYSTLKKLKINAIMELYNIINIFISKIYVTHKGLRLCHGPSNSIKCEIWRISLIELLSLSHFVLYDKPVQMCLHFSTASSGRSNVVCSVSLVPEALY